MLFLCHVWLVLVDSYWEKNKSGQNSINRKSYTNNKKIVKIFSKIRDLLFRVYKGLFRVWMALME